MAPTTRGRASAAPEAQEQPGKPAATGNKKKLPAKPLSKPPRTQPHRAAKGETCGVSEVVRTPPPPPSLSLDAPDQQELSQPLSTLCDVAQAYDDELLEAAGSVVDILREKEAEIRADLRDTLRKLTQREEQRLQRSAAIAACKQARRDKVAEAGGPRVSRDGCVGVVYWCGVLCQCGGGGWLAHGCMHVLVCKCARLCWNRVEQCKLCHACLSMSSCTPAHMFLQHSHFHNPPRTAERSQPRW